jgi:HrpA-like RNA helicase
MALRVICLIHASGAEGAVLVFVPGWFEIGELVKLLGACEHARELETYAEITPR